MSSPYLLEVEAQGRRLQLQVQQWQPRTARPGPTLVLLHEALGNLSLWRHFPAELAEATGLPVIAYCREGYGESSPLSSPRSDDYLVEQGRDWLPALLARLELDKVILLGHSDGGSIALVGAACCPERILAIVTLAAHIYVDPLTTQGIEQAVERYQQQDLATRLARYHGERTDPLFRAWAETWLRPSYQQLNLRPWLKQIRCPALIMQGEEDAYGLPSQVLDIVHGIGEQAEARFLPACGHSPHLEQAEAVIAAIQHWLEPLIPLTTP